MKKKIVFLNRCWLVGGMERVIAILANKLIDFFDVYILIYGEVKNDIFALNPNVTFKAIPADGGMGSQTVKFVKNEKIDLVIGNSGISTDMLNVYDELYNNNIKFVVCNHEYYFYPHYKISCMGTVFRRIDVLAKAEVSIFLTSFSLLAYSGFNNNGFLLPNPVSFDLKNIDMARIKAQNKTIIAVGRWNDPIKRLDRLLNVMTHVLEIEPKAKLLLVGPYNRNMKNKYVNETINEQIRRLKIPKNNINFLGEQEDVKIYYKQADIMLMTSDNEGFPMVLTEAGMMGLPVLIFDIPGLDDIVKDNENGYIIQQDDCKLMAEKVVEILWDDNLYSVLSKNAVRLAERFSQDEITKRWRNLIEMILSSDQKNFLRQYINKSVDKARCYSEKNIRCLSQEYEKVLYLEYQIMREVFDEKIEVDSAREKTNELEEHLSKRVQKLRSYLEYQKGD